MTPGPYSSSDPSRTEKKDISSVRFSRKRLSPDSVHHEEDRGSFLPNSLQFMSTLIMCGVMRRFSKQHPKGGFWKQEFQYRTYCRGPIRW